MDFRTACAFAVAMVMVGCSPAAPAPSTTPSSTPTASVTVITAPTATPTATATATATATSSTQISGHYPANGRELFIDCVGSGSPTIVIEAGEGQISDEMADLKADLARDRLVCSYDRANHGQSDAAPTPRTAQDIVSDLHALLDAARVPGPYVLIGHSAGGMFVQLFARSFESETAGVLIMNPVPPCREWMEAAFPAMTPSERADEQAYYAGANDEPVDYCASSDQIDEAPGPPQIPLEMLISTIAQCESPNDICGRTYPAYTDVMRSLTQSWPGGNFSQVESIHSIYVARPDVVEETLATLLGRI